MFLSLKSSWFFSTAIIILILLVLPSVSAAQNRVTRIPDFNGDGKADLIWHNPGTEQSVVWLMDGIAASTTSGLPSEAGWKLVAAADFNGDGMADLLWRNASNGQLIQWLMNGTSIVSSTVLLSDPLWTVMEVADLNGDGRSDLIMHNASTGQTVGWLINGSTVTSWSLLLTDTSLKVTATADFNGDGMADLLWFNENTGQTAAWLMNGTTQLSAATLGTDPNWKVAATADFNLDNLDDLLWYNAATGETSLWLMNGIASMDRVTLQTDLNWKVLTTGDLNGDGKADLLWNNSATGQTAAWLMNGANVLSNATLQTDLNWKVSGTADLNGDTRSDILWYNVATGQTAVWLMNGTVGTSGANLFTDSVWRLQCIKSSTLTSVLACNEALANASVGNVPVPPNQAPVVTAGSDQTITFPAVADLSGTASDDGVPIGLMTTSWSQVSGPGTVVFGNASLLKTTATFSSAGTYTLRLTAKDSQLSTSDNLVIVVGNSSPSNANGKKNLAPLVDAGPDQTIVLPATANLEGSATDDGLPSKTLTASWSKVKGKGNVTFSDATAFLTEATFSAPGSYTLRLSASDGALSRNDEVVIVVDATAATNQPPVVNAGPDQMMALPASANLAGTATDDGLPTGSALTTTWSKVNGPGTVIFSSASALNSTATFSTAGTYELRLTASDSKASTSDEVTIVVSAAMSANKAPVVNGGTDQTVTLPAGLTLSGTATDDNLPEGSTTSVSWSKVSGPGTVVFVNANSPGATAAISAAGTYILRLTATDGLLSSSDDVVITVIEAPVSSILPVNLAPVVNAGPDSTMTLPNGITLGGSATDDGLPSGSTLSKAWSKVSGPGIVTFGNAAALNSTANFSAAGTYTLRLTATDGSLSTSDDAVFVVNAAQVNLAPVVNAGPDSTMTLPNGITLGGSATDDGLPSGSTLSKAWSQVSGPGTVTFGNAAALNSTANFSVAGTYTLRLTATDGSLSTSDDAVFVVNAAQVNLAPVVNAGPDYTITLPNGITLVGSASDDGLPTGSALSKAWSKVSGPGTVTFGNAASLNSTANFSVAGTYTLRLTATDSSLSTSDDVVFVVNAAQVNLAPVVNAGPDHTITLPNGITLVGSASDDGLPTGSTLSKAWSKVSGPGTVTFGNAAALNSTANFSVAGTYTLRLTATDSALSTSDDVVFVVNAAQVNLAPVVNAGPDHTITLPNGITLVGSASDDGLPTGSTLSKAWSKVSGPGTVTFGNAAALNSTANFSVAGTYTLRLTATDSALSTSDDVVFVVNAAQVNLAPVVNAGPDQTITLPAEAVLAGTASDDALPAGSTLSKTWSTVSGPSTVSFSSPSALNSIAAFPIAGTYTLRLTASDGALSSSDDVVILVKPVTSVNAAPVVSAGPDQTVVLPSAANLSGSATDDGLPSGSTLTRTWNKVSGPGIVTFGAVNALATTATFSTTGIYVLQLTASDGLLSSSSSLTVTVNSSSVISVVSKNIFVSQNATGAGTGTDCSNALPVSFVTNAANWGTGATQIGPGTTVNLCGTITGGVGTIFPVSSRTETTAIPSLSIGNPEPKLHPLFTTSTPQ